MCRMLCQMDKARGTLPRLVKPGLPHAQASVAVNSIGLFDLVQIAAVGLTPKSQYHVYLASSYRAPFGRLEPLAVLKTNPAGAGIVQAIGPLKVLANGGVAAGGPPHRFLIVSELQFQPALRFRSRTYSGNLN
jgi:hypothetical protein